MGWRILIVEDRPETSEQIAKDAESGKLLPDVGRMETKVFSKFEDAVGYLDSGRFDFLVLDLKQDDIEEDQTPGLTVFNEIKQTRFVPVVFYTALPQYVRELETAFVKVVEKTEGLQGLRRKIKSIYDTKLPCLVKHLEKEQSKYMWDFIGDHWSDDVTSFQHTDIAYLLARRLAHTLKQPSIRSFLSKDGAATPAEHDIKKIHPMEMYIHPVSLEDLFAGHIIKGSVNGVESYWLLLTPSCDFEQNHVEQVLLARCSELSSFDEYEDFQRTRSGDSKGNLKCLMKDRRKSKQSERYKFLPGTFFMPDLVVDFQKLVHVTKDELNEMQAIAALDTPFAEALITRFSRYYGRIGTPDLDINPVILRVESVLSDLE